MRSSLAVVVFFIIKLESYKSPMTDFVAEDKKKNIFAIFVYIAAKFEYESNSRKMFEYS